MSLSSVISDIKKIKIQGATNIAKQGLLALSSEVNSNMSMNQSQLLFYCDQLAGSRPTEPLLHNGLAYILQNSNVQKEQIAAMVSRSVADYLTTIQKSEDLIIQYGQKLIKPQDQIMTHCHSSLVAKILTVAQQNNNLRVINTETRPLYQGRITAGELVAAGITVSTIVDSLAAAIIFNQQKNNKIHKIIIGADALSWQGDVYNKVGSFSLALAAKYAKVPFYVATESLKIDSDNQIIIERRSSEEVWPDKPQQVQIINPAFDYIPAKYISGIITEFGIIHPTKLKLLVKKNYPWLIIKKK
ncbi:MAG: hypothetical protein COX77_01425 [Candidatus Komeilibacteria bacterium CG_4_10_14_0_2_um_filter_37_10]|uniref:Translation initiation factor eIF-2B n=1 Tax=Candidatus Komeilibacteria bacterium CG_4_10_14_0_2_um_filter_37_10 TaxID=1974470 RepID=A0A2M7VFR6_9BACT|nr:MAG: hypothetical protein COX77_01425 [Candidatus Komeilibacteria bacterium CG_4_10_14_0_2_um_filter_37_10]